MSCVQAAVLCDVLSRNFMNLMREPLSCEKSRVILPVPTGLMAGWLTGRQSDEILLRFSTGRIVRIFTEFNEGQCYYIIVLPMHFSQFLG